MKKYIVLLLCLTTILISCEQPEENHLDNSELKSDSDNSKLEINSDNSELESNSSSSESDSLPAMVNDSKSPLVQETEDLIQRSISDFQLFEKEHYSMYLKVLSRSEDGVSRIFFDVKVFGAKKSMKDVTLSALLPDEAYQYINAAYLSFTNIDAVLSDAPRKYFSLIPGNEEIKGIAIGRSFLLNENGKFTEESISEIASNVKIKVSWVDDQEKVHVDYLRMPKDMTTIDESLFN
jgi:hypothetical protein